MLAMLLVQRHVLLLQPLLLSGNHILPQVAATLGRLFLLDLRHGSLLLLLLLRRIQDPLALALVGDLKPRRGHQHRQGQALGVDTSLDDLLLPGEVGVAADEDEGADHGGDPGGADDLVLLAAGPEQRAVDHGQLGELLGAQALLAVLVPLHLLVALGLEGPRGVVGGDDAHEGPRRGHEEGLHGDGEVADGVVAARGEHDTGDTADETQGGTETTAFDDGAVQIRVLV